ncbi:enoyl-CoA hydratase/isomerase family protein [Pseudogracilibacillus auburnensis]|uniref:Enoyl-CoA hydratase/carnithine racemase n=1 Tax=Pseudogracilibacillus auburnensis TaxID=1494959 RepID=A0A2V3WAS4_9BACI|nr:enoyl-CoA hydratase/isomerase family protein [Pseudogracilibacillus auburnensis]PXW90111.1 enoyl-CoA hydratase/carnithine racemase [Pseudogracilibacillus auburnensis]
MYETIKLKESLTNYTIIFNRPEKLNALSEQMIEELHATLLHVKEKNPKVLLLKGEGTSFCTGHDVNSSISFANEEDAMNKLGKLQEITSIITNYPAPVVAALHGYALGAGFEIALNCDLLYASDQAIFGFPELEVGLSITQGTSYFLPRAIGLTKSKEFIFFSEKITAQKAKELSLINEVFNDDHLFESVNKKIDILSKKSLFALNEVKQLLNNGMNASLDHSLKHEITTLSKLLS